MFIFIIISSSCSSIRVVVGLTSLMLPLSCLEYLTTYCMWTLLVYLYSPNTPHAIAKVFCSALFVCMFAILTLSLFLIRIIIGSDRRPETKQETEKN